MNLFRRVLTYRVALYYLAAIVLVALALSVAGIVHQPPLNLAFSIVVALSTCLIVNWAFARAFGAERDWESVSISALIIVLIITPPSPTHLTDVAFLVFVSAWAMASKYMVATRKRHIFNPAAFAAVLIGIGFNHTVSWWVGDYAVLLPLIIAGGALMLTRLRYYEMVTAFAVVVLGTSVAYGDLTLAGVGRSLSVMGIHSMFCFFGLVMLTEPRTAPVGRWRQIVYGALVGLLFSPYTHIGRFYFTPEIAIVCGNLFAFFSNRRRLGRWAQAIGVALPSQV